MERLCKIRDLQRAVGQFEANFEKLYGLCLNEGMALCSLARAGRLSSGELGELLGLTLSNTSKVISSIENKGLVEREMGTTDKRRMFFILTPKGRELLATLDCEKADIPELLGLFM
jgi:DNA-binding MarR family transcriptional regulator